MFCKALLIAAFVTSVYAFPAAIDLERRETVPKTCSAYRNEPNSGFFPNTGFDAKAQFIDVRPGSGHEFIAPGKDDVRGPCPGLNAAANHGFISRTGIIDFRDTTKNLPAVFGLGPRIANFFFYAGLYSSGSIINEKWSIGGPIKEASLGDLGQGLGLSNSHNKLEGDGSPCRGDAFLYNGDSHSLNLPQFANLYKAGEKQGDITFLTIRRQTVRNHQFSIDNNPDAFFGPAFFNPLLSYQYIVAFMSNHSETEVQGILTLEVLKSFFSVVKPKNGPFEWIPGQERIPLNWYKRPASNPYDADAAFGDLAITATCSPQVIELGGNVGMPDTFESVDIGKLTGNLYKSATLLSGNNLLCFSLEGLAYYIAGTKTLPGNPPSTFPSSVAKEFGCPQFTTYNLGLFQKFPGFAYRPPLQPDTPY